MIFTNPRKNHGGGPISVGISTTGSHPNVKGGRQHDTIVRRAADEHGQAAAEHAALLAFAAGVLFVAYQLFVGQVAALYDRVLAAFT